MTKASQLIATLALLANSVLAEEPKNTTFSDNKLANSYVSISFDLKQGSFSIHDADTAEALLTDARFGLPSGEKHSGVEILKVEDVKDELGSGKKVILEVSDWNLLRYADFHASAAKPATHLFSYTLYDEHPGIVIGFGMNMPIYQSMRLMRSTPLANGTLFGGKKLENPQTLNGGAGADPTLVKNSLSRIAANSLMLTTLVDGKRRTVVWGGLKQKEFGKFARLRNGTLGLFAEDPVGRLINDGQTYLADDTFYLDLVTRDPFTALEKYGQAMRAVNHASPNVYDFPVLCGWSTSHISKLPNINNSAKLIGEIEAANKSGITRYTKCAIRLEPDKYNFDTEQGWWDDEHMRKFKHLVEPYDTIASWSKALRERNGIPYIYMQLGMPSDDFVRAHPEWMLFNDGSEVDRVAPNMKGKKKHRHHHPFVTYDYTDKEFSEHFLKVWSKLHEDGIQGVKVDYPATAWRPEGGFDDRYATTNSAYRRAFTLLREAFGPDGLIDERNIGESGRPCLDITAGLVDTQRTWGDSNEFIPLMISKSGLRWYKNRTVFNYYSDTKTTHNQDESILQSLITMNYLTSGRLDLATSFTLFTPDVTRIVSRSYPHYPEAISARPLDAFTGVADPQVYDLELTPNWHQITLYNTGDDTGKVSTSISGDRVNNAIGLDPKGEYHAYEFWTDTYLGKLSGDAKIEHELKPNRCAMISVRTAQNHPQVISTDRHLLQGWIELDDIQWDSKTKTLSGKADLIADEAMTIVIANNGSSADKAMSKTSTATLKPSDNNDLTRLTLLSADAGETEWSVQFK